MRLPALLVPTAAFALAVGCAPPEEKRPLNLLLVVVDTLRADHLGAYDYSRNTSPHIDRLAAHGAVFERAYSHSPWTAPSVASLLTSLPPRDHGITDWRQPLSTTLLRLPQQFSQHGYFTAAVVSQPVFSQPYNLEVGFEHYDTSVLDGDEIHQRATAGEVTDRALDLLAELTPARPFFLLVYYFDPHFQYVKHDDFDFGDAPIDRYDGEIAFTDHHLGRLLDGLEASGDGERTIVVFTSDHGEEFKDHGGLQHSSTLYEELIRIPLIMAVPGFRPQRVDSVVSQSDIAPTLLSLAGLPVPEQFSGTPFRTDRDHFAPGAGRTIFAETFRGGGEKRGVLFDDWKMILNLTEQRIELYDLAADRVEARNRAEAEPRAVERGLRLLEEHYAQQRRQPEEMPPYPELQQQLESLGYLEEADSARGRP